MKRVLVFTLACMLMVPGFANLKKDLRKAKKGDAQAQYNVALCYEKGEGVEQDHTQAAHWYTKAAEQGHAEAQCNLGACYALSRGVEQDYTQAVYWFRKAAEQGDPYAIEVLQRSGY